MTPLELAAATKRAAAELGFDACGITAPGPATTGAALDNWLAQGRHGEMAYLARQARIRNDPVSAWPDAKSVVVVLHNYYQTQDVQAGGYRVARYAQGEDYHAVMGDLLARLGGLIRSAAGGGRTRAYVDAGPMPERELAQRAGLGWFGKNTMLIRPALGSFTFIGVVLTDLELARDPPFEADRCGSCRRCLDACPTDAFPAARVLDARRCVSYLTIEARSDVPAELRAGVGDNLFGCDICQEVCPWNVKFARGTGEPRYLPDRNQPLPAAEQLVVMDRAAYRLRFAATALRRAGLEGLKRNARVVIENRRQAGRSSIRVSSGGQPHRIGSPPAPTPRDT